MGRWIYLIISFLFLILCMYYLFKTNFTHTHTHTRTGSQLKGKPPWSLHLLCICSILHISTLIMNTRLNWSFKSIDLARFREQQEIITTTTGNASCLCLGDMPQYLWACVYKLRLPNPCPPQRVAFAVSCEKRAQQIQRQNQTLTGQVDLLWESTVPEERYIIYPEVEETTEEEGN